MQDAIRLIHAYYNEKALAEAFKAFECCEDDGRYDEKINQAEHTAECLAKHILVRFKQDLKDLPDTIKELYANE